MGVTTAMLTGFTGIQAHSTMMDTIGDNVANVSTTAFKSQRTLFETLFYRTLDSGSGPGEVLGGTNPKQVGNGVGIGAIQRNFNDGVIEDTGVKTDVAIDGNGFLILNDPAGNTVYTRDGAMELDENHTLVTANNGSKVMGYLADESGEIQTGTLSSLSIPLGTERVAQATTEVQMDGNLDADSVVAGSGSITQTQALNTAGGTPATDGTALTSLVDDNDAPLFATGDVIQISGIQHGGIDVPETTFTVGTDGSTLGDLATFLENKLAINTTAVPGTTAGVRVENGSLVIESNEGIANNITLTASSIRNETSGNLPFEFTETQEATGDGTTTSLIVYDSLGNSVEVRLRVALESATNSGNTWRFYAESSDNQAASPVIGSGTLTFDQNGKLVASTGTELSVDRSNTGATTPLTFTVNYDMVTGLARGDASPQLIMDTQNGRPAGTLIDFEIDEEGIITGKYDNSSEIVLGQLGMAMFANPEGLIADSNNVFTPGPNSGDPVLTTAGLLGAGDIAPRSLENSNVELSREFMNLITAQTGFSANSRVISSADNMLQELMTLLR